MSGLKFNLTDLIANPDNYTSGERKQASDSVAALIGKAAAIAGAVEFRIDDPRAAALDELRAAIAVAGGTA